MKKLYKFLIHRPLCTLSKKFSRKGIYLFLNKEFSRIQKGADVLNIGAGGDIEKLLQRYAQNTEFSVTYLDIDPNRKPDIVADICIFDAPEASYDAIIMSEILEHIPTPHKAADNIFRLLKPRGRLILTVPFIFPIHDRPHDYFRYTLYGLQHLFAAFEKLDIRARNNWADAMIVLWMRFVIEKHMTARLFFPFAVLIGLILFVPLSVLGRVVKMEASTTGYLMTGEKPHA